jgi:hypothetical protein
MPAKQQSSLESSQKHSADSLNSEKLYDRGPSQNVSVTQIWLGQI